MKKIRRITTLICIGLLSSALTIACVLEIDPAPSDTIPQPVATAVENSTVPPANNAEPAPAESTAEEETPVPAEEDAAGAENSTPEATAAGVVTEEVPLKFTDEPAPVSAIDVTVMDDPVRQVNVTAQGEFSDGCTQIAEITQTMTGNTFVIEITTRRPVDMMCTMALMPFEETVALDVSGLDAGTYTVEVNGVRETFELGPEASD